MEAVYQLLNIDRGVPEVFASAFDIRTILNATSHLIDGKTLDQLDLPFLVKYAEKKGIEKSKGTIIYDLLKDAKLI